MKSQRNINFFMTIGVLVSVTIIFASSIAHGLNDNISLIYSWPGIAEGQEQGQEQQDNSIDGGDATTNNNNNNSYDKNEKNSEDNKNNNSNINKDDKTK